MFNYIRKISRSIAQHRYCSERPEFKKLTYMKRFKPGKIKLFDRDFHFIDAASFLAAYREIFEKGIYNFVADNKNPYIVDGGANVGMSIVYFKRLYPQSRIIAFEPDKKAFQALEKNIRFFGYKDIKLIPKALWNSGGVHHFMHEGGDGSRLAREHEDGKHEEVETVRLSDYLNETVDFLKIDIEGAETKVLEDSVDKLENVKNIFIEYHSFENEEQSLDELLSILKEKGFRYWIHQGGFISMQPLFKVKVYFGMDLLLNIFAKNTRK